MDKVFPEREDDKSLKKEKGPDRTIVEKGKDPSIQKKKDDE